jgi:hypothetical protein
LHQDALILVSVSMLAVAGLANKRWLQWAAAILSLAMTAIFFLQFLF